MSRTEAGATSTRAVRSALAERLRANVGEIEERMLVRISDEITDPLGGRDPEYARGLRIAVRSMLEFALKAIDEGDEWVGPIPSAAAEQARRAAREGVGLQTVLRRYFAGYAVLESFVTAEVGRFPNEPVRRVLSHLAGRLDRVAEVISEEFNAEVTHVTRSPQMRRAHRVQRLLEDEQADPEDLRSELRYDFENRWHVAVIARGPDAHRAPRLLASALDRQLLPLPRSKDTVGAWLGGQRRLAVTSILDFLATKPLGRVSLAVGDPGADVAGWRRTYRQAQAALLIAERCPQPITTYFDVGLTAVALRDEAEARQLVKVYLRLLCDPDPATAVLRDTLTAYFEAGRRATVAADILDVERRTVTNRLHTIEERLGFRLDGRLAELEVALRLFALLEGHA